MSTSANSEDRDIAAFHQGLQFAKTKTIYREKKTIFFVNYNLWVTGYNLQKKKMGPSKVYCIKPEGRIH